MTTVLSVSLAACDSLDTNRTVEPYSSFGGIVYREGCQRLAYTGQLAQQQAGQITKVDVSGALGRAVCVDDMPSPSGAPAALAAIQGQKSLLVTTVDAILPKDFLSTLEGFLEAILPLADDGTTPDAVAAIGQVLGVMHDDPDFSAALARLAVRSGYRPTKIAPGLVNAVVNYPGIDAFLSKTLALIAPGGTAETEWKSLLSALAMELKTAQPVSDPNDPERTLKLALNLILTTNPDLGSGTTLPLVQRDYRGLAMVATDSTGKPLAPFVDKDGDGLADVDGMGHFVDVNGQPLDVPTPFPQAGQPDTAPRDQLGRALTGAQATSTLYNYLNLDGTVIGGMTREALTLMDPTKDTTLGLVWGAAALLGPRMMQTKMYMDPAGGMAGALAYNGFDTDQAAVLDLLHAFIQLLGDPNIDPTLETASTLLSKFESPATRAVGAMLDASDRGKMHPEAQIVPTSTLYDDLIPVMVRVLRVPGLAQDILQALEDPRVAAFAPMMARLMVANNQIDFNHSAGPGYPLTSNLDNVQMVDRTMPDVDYNRSLMQRIAHMIHDAEGAQFCNKAGATFKDPITGIISFPIGGGTYAKCGLFEIDDLSLFYVLNMATPSLVSSTKGTSREATTYHLANFCEQIKDGTVKTSVESGLVSLESQTGVTGFTCQPTPAALNRALFLRPSEQTKFMQETTDPVSCVDGDLFTDVHDKSIFAWETPMASHPEAKNFYDAVQPLVDAFVKHDECVQTDANGKCTKLQNAAKIFVDLLATLHKHYGSSQTGYFGHTFQSTDPTMPRYANLDNVVSYEPLMSEVLGQSDLMPSVLNLVPTLNNINIDGTPVGGNGIPARNALIATAQYLLDPVNAQQAGVAYRNGMTSTVESDGKTPVPVATPYYLLADAYAHKRAALASTTMDQQNAWKQATSNLVDQMLTVEKLNSGQYQFKNRHVHAVTLILIDFIRSRLATHAKAGDLTTWVHHTLTQNLTDILGGPVFAGLTDFTAKVESDPDARNQLYGLLQYLVDEADHDAAFQTALTTLADQSQMFLDDPDLVPVARVMGSAFDPSTGAVDKLLTMVKKSHDVDSKDALLTVLKNMYVQNASGGYPASDLADVLSEINRANPGQGGPLDASDYQSILGNVRDFLLDSQRGFTAFLNIVKQRGPHN